MQTLTAYQIYRRAGGRRKHNAECQRKAAARRRRVAVLLAQGMAQQAIARRLHVSRFTIRRDTRFLDDLPSLLAIFAAVGAPVKYKIGVHGWTFEAGG